MTGGDWRDSRIRSRHKDLHPEPMFDVATRRAGEPHPKPPRPVDEGKCPLCGQKVAIYVLRMDGLTRVLAYRQHYRKTHGGTSFLCRRSDTEINAPA